MRALRLAAVAAVATAAALAAPASARTHYQQLAGDTTITASSSGSALVDLPDDVSMSWKATGNPDISISGPGRLVGFMLSPLGQQGYSLDSLLVLRIPKNGGTALKVFGLASPTDGPTCTQIGEDPSQPLGGCTEYKDPGYGFYYEGRYKLTVLTDGSPVTISLRLHGLDGATTIRPTTRIATVEATMTPREALGTTVVSGGTHAMTMTKAGFYIAYGQLKRASGGRYRENELCSIDGSLAETPGAYLPGSCGDGAAAVIDPMQNLPADWDGLNGGLGWGSIDAGTYGMGFNAQGDTSVSFLGGAVAFLPGV